MESVFLHNFKKNLYINLKLFLSKILPLTFTFINNKLHVLVSGCDAVGHFSVEPDVSAGGQHLDNLCTHCGILRHSCCILGQHKFWWVVILIQDLNG